MAKCTTCGGSGLKPKSKYPLESKPKTPTKSDDRTKSEALKKAQWERPSNKPVKGRKVK